MSSEGSSCNPCNLSESWCCSMNLAIESVRAHAQKDTHSVGRFFCVRGIVTRAVLQIETLVHEIGQVHHLKRLPETKWWLPITSPKNDELMFITTSQHCWDTWNRARAFNQTMEKNLICCYGIFLYLKKILNRKWISLVCLTELVHQSKKGRNT